MTLLNLWACAASKQNLKESEPALTDVSIKSLGDARELGQKSKFLYQESASQVLAAGIAQANAHKSRQLPIILARWIKWARPYALNKLSESYLISRMCRRF
jgi:hypothetical protein